MVGLDKFVADAHKVETMGHDLHVIFIYKMIEMDSRGMHRGSLEFQAHAWKFQIWNSKNILKL